MLLGSSRHGDLRKAKPGDKEERTGSIRLGNFVLYEEYNSNSMQNPSKIFLGFYKCNKIVLFCFQELESYAYESGEGEVPSNLLLERQRIVMGESMSILPLYFSSIKINIHFNFNEH